jgi:hypothetical protein
VLGAFVDNIPYTAAMAPIVEDVVNAAPDPAQGRRCGGRSPWGPTSAQHHGGGRRRQRRGPGIAARQGQPISFWRFTRLGLVVTAVTLVVAWVYVWLRYYAFL